MTCRAAIHGGPAMRASRSPTSPDGTSDGQPAARRPRAAWRTAALRVAGGLVALLLSLGFAGLASAEELHDTARLLVDAALRDSVQAFDTPNLSRPEAAQRLRGLIDRYVDIPRIGRTSLGFYWQRTPQLQQADFLAVFEDFLVASYADAVQKLGTVRFSPATVIESGDARAVLRTEMQLAEDSSLPVLITVRRADDGAYRITDVVVEAISMSKLLSADFSSVVRLNGGRVEALIDALQQKLALAHQADSRQ